MIKGTLDDYTLIERLKDEDSKDFTFTYDH